MRTARQISAQAKKKKVEPCSVKPIVVTKLIAPNARVAEKLTEENMKAKDKPIVNHVLKSNEPIECEFYIPGFFQDNKEDGYYVVNANGYTKEQLSTELPKEDIDYIEQGLKIPLNFGLGVEVIHKGDRLLYKRGGNSYRGKPTVTLEISTWRGVSCGAIHYYGNLRISLPDAHYVGNPEKEKWTTSTYIPMYHRNDIELTQELEQWEIDKYPENYKDYYYAGQRHKGFYTVKQVKEYAELVFEQIFEKGWNYRVEER